MQAGEPAGRSPEGPPPAVGGVADGRDQVPVRGVAGRPGQLRGSPGQRAHGAVRRREVQQQLQAALLGAGAAARVARAREQRAHPPASNGAVPAPSLISRLVIMSTWICNVMALQRS